MPRPKAPYPAQFRQQMIDLVATRRRPSEPTREFGCHETLTGQVQVQSLNTKLARAWLLRLTLKPKKGGIVSGGPSVATCCHRGGQDAIWRIRQPP
jgi:hypothetical protein